MKVTSFVRYLTGQGLTRRQGDWDASKLVHALKGDDFSGYANFARDGVSVNLSASHGISRCQTHALDAVATVLATVVKQTTSTAVLVPVPSSQSTVNAPVQGASSKLAHAIVQKTGGSYWAVDAVAFTQAIQSARSGGERNPKRLLPLLQVVGRPWDRRIPVIIVDDVITRGGHLLASAECLRQSNYQVLGGVVAARTVLDQDLDALGLMEHTFTDPFDPSYVDPFGGADVW